MREMKDSGVYYLDNIPESWDVATVKKFFSITRGRVIAKTEIFDEVGDNLYPVYSSQTKKDGCLGYISSFDFDVDSLTWTTDGANAGTVFLRKGKYSITNVCGILTPKYVTISLNFANYAIGLSAYHTRRADINGYKVMSNEMALIKFAFPPIEEQITIAKYLDERLSKVDALIANQEAQIEKLKAYKQSLITEVVTKGLDPNAPMKPSGVEWIGEIPELWEKTKIKFVTLIVRGGSPRPIEDYMSDNDDGYNWIKIGDTVKGSKYINSAKTKIIEAGLSKTRLVHKGDLILTNSMSFGEPYILGIDGCIHDGWLAFTDFKGISKEFLYYCLISNLCLSQFSESVEGGIVQNLNINKVKNSLIFLPSLEEQAQIVEYLDGLNEKFERLIGINQQKIEKLNQYKKSLIYEYVTGKKEVV